MINHCYLRYNIHLESIYFIHYIKLLICFFALETCRCPKILTTAWENIAPLVHINGTLSGIMPKYINEAVSICCGNCKFGQGPTTVDWNHDALNKTSMKTSIESMMQAIAAETHIAIPFFKDKVESEGSLSLPYIYIPVLQSPGMAFFKRNPTNREVGNEGASYLIDSLLNLYSVLVVVILFMATAGMIFWLLVSGTSLKYLSHFHRNGVGL